MMVKNIPIAGIILRHNDSKTIKFLFRNFHYLLAINIQK